jgi:S-methylmethionine-dependent homocysteine/selenocysteine methylase
MNRLQHRTERKTDMARYRHALPNLKGSLFISDGGLETSLVFNEGIDLPEFAAFVLLENEHGRDILTNYFEHYLDIAVANKLGIILETPTWRASQSWGEKTGHPAEVLEQINHDAVQLLTRLRAARETDDTPVVISGCIGPRGDGYAVDEKLSIDEATSYHATQINTLERSGADLVTAFTLNHVEEALGITRASRDADIPVVIGFTVETDGRLPSGQSLAEAIGQVDAETDAAPVYYMINCAHPTHFRDALAIGHSWQGRVHAVRANASCKSHAELDESTELDAGNPEELGTQYRELRSVLKNLHVVGGCCGTDHNHVNAIVRHWR